MRYERAKRKVLNTLVPAIGEDFYTLPAWHLTYRVTGYLPNGWIIFDLYEHDNLISKNRRFPLADIWRKLADGSMKRPLP